ncbi:protein-export membrane protein SecF [Helicobacter enhydrae]|uniref:Protein-export membrane protein SecF n=1 Tax=Helicobacter enhydrae TaxID=222136 RepID=A0A1B1U4U2_9HELI|nr:protein translocase subunit SecF [Helicobacter enhydrae]ANV97768.1 protein-export membrane protein SecF [Helicobacter enhydrae]
MELIRNQRIINFAQYNRYTFLVSVVLIALSCAILFFKGFSYGVDFDGGTIVQIRYEQNAPISTIRMLLEKNQAFKGVQVSEFGSKDEALLKIPFNAKLPLTRINEEVIKALKGSGQFELRRVDSVGPKVGQELKEKGILALSLALIAILVYVSFRYEWKFALSAVFALFHDVLICAASVVVFGIDLNLEVIAAFLTIIGYSINDTIIIFDRIREQTMKESNASLNDVINEALSSTLSRTLLTSLTVLFVVLTLYLFGGEIIVGFSLPMLVGVIIGTYSSMFFAPRMIVLLGFDLSQYRDKLAEKKKREREREKMRQMYQNGQV